MVRRGRGMEGGFEKIRKPFRDEDRQQGRGHVFRAKRRRSVATLENPPVSGKGSEEVFSYNNIKFIIGQISQDSIAYIESVPRRFRNIDKRRDVFDAIEKLLSEAGFRVDKSNGNDFNVKITGQTTGEGEKEILFTDSVELMNFTRSLVKSLKHRTPEAHLPETSELLQKINFQGLEISKDDYKVIQEELKQRSGNAEEVSERLLYILKKIGFTVSVKVVEGTPSRYTLYYATHRGVYEEKVLDAHEIRALVQEVLNEAHVEDSEKAQVKRSFVNEKVRTSEVVGVLEIPDLELQEGEIDVVKKVLENKKRNWINTPQPFIRLLQKVLNNNTNSSFVLSRKGSVENPGDTYTIHISAKEGEVKMELTTEEIANLVEQIIQKYLEQNTLEAPEEHYRIKQQNPEKAETAKAQAGATPIQTQRLEEGSRNEDFYHVDEKRNEEIDSQIRTLKLSIEEINKAVQEGDAGTVLKSYRIKDKHSTVGNNKSAERKILKYEAEIRRLEREKQFGIQGSELDIDLSNVEPNIQAVDLDFSGEEPKVPPALDLEGEPSNALSMDTFHKVEEAVKREKDYLNRIYAGRNNKGTTSESAHETPSSNTPESSNNEETLEAEDVTGYVKNKFKRPLDISDEEIITQGNKDTAPETVSVFEARFKTEFGINPEDLRSIEGFENLSKGQQSLVFENFTQLTLGTVREEASRLSSESLGKRREEMTNLLGRVLGNAVSGVRETFTKSHTEFKTEQEVAHQMRTGGFEVHKDLLEQLIRGMAKHGPRVHEDSNGELIIDLVNIRERAKDKEVRDAEWFAMKELNESAHAFAKIPAGWRGETLGVDTGEEWKVTSFLKEKIFKTKEKTNSRVYEEREDAYNESRKALENILRTKGKNDLEIAQILVDIDSRVNQLQSIQTNPDAIQELANIENKSFWKEIAKNLVSGPGLYMSLGFVGRSLLATGAGVLAAPITAAGIGYLRSWNKSAAELRERDRNARAGVHDGKEGALNIVSAEDVTIKTRNLLDRCSQATGEKKISLLAQLRARVDYIHDKQMLQRVSYGNKNEIVTNQVNLTEVLSEALAYLIVEDGAGSKEAHARLDKSNRRLEKQLTQTEENIIITRRGDRVIGAQKGMASAALFSIAGMALADYARAEVVGTKISPQGVPQGATPPNVSPAGTPESLVVTPETSNTGTLKYPLQEELESSGTPEAESPIDSSLVEEPKGSPETATRVESAKLYTIQRGDTLTKILKTDIPLIRDMGDTHARENALQKIFTSLTKEELQKIGIKSGNVHLIYAGDEVNIKALNTIIEGKKSLIEKAQTRFGSEAPRAYVREVSRGTIPFSESQYGREISAGNGIRETVIPLYEREAIAPLEDGYKTPEETPKLGESKPAQSAPEEDLPGEPINPGTATETEKPTAKAPVTTTEERPGSAVTNESEVVSESKPDKPSAIAPQEPSAPKAGRYENPHKIIVDREKPNVYEITIEGKKGLVSYGGNFTQRFDTAQDFVKKNPDSVVLVESEEKYHGTSGKKLEPTFIRIENSGGTIQVIPPRPEIVLSIQEQGIEARPGSEVNPDLFTKRLTSEAVGTGETLPEPANVRVAYTENAPKPPVVEVSHPVMDESFKKAFFSENIADRDWNKMKSMRIENIQYDAKILNGYAEPAFKKLMVLRLVVEHGLGVAPQPGESIESYMARGSEALAKVNAGKVQAGPDFKNMVRMYEELIADRKYPWPREPLPPQNQFFGPSHLNEPYRAGDWKARMNYLKRGR